MSLLADRYIGFSPAQLLVPLASSYRPVQTALGVVGMYLVAVITASFYLRRYIGYRAWRTIHSLTFGAFALSFFHGVTAGSDTGSAWASTLYWGTGAMTLVLFWWRFFTARAGEPRARSVEWTEQRA